LRIKVIIPNSSEAFRDEQKEERKNNVSNGVDVEVVCLPKGPVSIETSTDEAYAAPYILEEVKKAEREGYDAVTIDGGMDPLLRAVKEVVNVPVVLAGEASRLMALALGSKFSIITTLKESIPAFEHLVAAQGISARLASIRAADVPVLEIQDYKTSKVKILEEAKKAVEGKLAREVQKEIAVPVVEPSTAALKFAEDFVQMGLRNSRKSFPKPLEKEIK
jgi:allantoin racemase